MAKKLFFLVIVLLNLQINCMQLKNNDKKDESTLLDALISRFGKKIDREKHYRGEKDPRASMNIMRSLFHKKKTPKDFTRPKLDLLLIDIITKNITMSNNQKMLVLLMTKVYPFFRDYCREHDALLSDQESGYLELLTTKNALGPPTNRATKKKCFENIRATLFNMANKQRRKRKKIPETKMALANKMLKQRKKNYKHHHPIRIRFLFKIGFCRPCRLYKKKEPKNLCRNYRTSFTPTKRNLHAKIKGNVRRAIQENTRSISKRKSLLVRSKKIRIRFTTLPNRCCIKIGR